MRSTVKGPVIWATSFLIVFFNWKFFVDSRTFWPTWYAGTSEWYLSAIFLFCSAVLKRASLVCHQIRRHLRK